MKLLVMQLSPSFVTSSLFSPSTLLSTLFSNTFTLCFSLNIRDKVSHPYRTTGQIINFNYKHNYKIKYFVF
jgi:hypothetical protein